MRQSTPCSFLIDLVRNLFFTLIIPCSAATATDSKNLGLAVNFSKQSPLGYIAFTVPEHLQAGQDLNGDGDTDGADEVLHIYDANTNKVTNLRLSIGGSGYRIKDNRVLFQVFESSQGHTDLNGDGDASDGVVFFYDLLTGQLTNTMIHAVPIGVSSNDQIYLAAPENQNGGIDFNGDGDTVDLVAHVYDIPTDSLINLGVAAGGYSPQGEGFAILTPERSQGNTDLNGDGDTLDSVLHVYDSRDGSLTNTMRSAEGNPAHELFAVLAKERSDNTDWNGDGDISDNVLQFYDMNTRSFINIGRSIQSPVEVKVSGNNVAFISSEAAEGNTDLNGDGDASDDVLFVYLRDLDILLNLGLATDRWSYRINGNKLAFLVNESDQHLDLNNDGDAAFDRVLHLYDFNGGQVTNLEVAVFNPGQIQLTENYLGYSYSEWRNGSTDLNGDGDAIDFLLNVYDFDTGINTYLGVEGWSNGEIDGTVVLTYPESRNAEDYNDDGDNNDVIIHLLDSNDLSVENTKNSGNPLVVGSVLFTSVAEFEEGADLNGDGDQSDLVVFIIDPFAEPITTISDLISFLQEANLSHGLEIALITKLESALAAQERGSVKASENSLGAFINQVEAQRGKGISDELADELIEIAQEIIDAD